MPRIDQAVALLERGRLLDAHAAGERILAAKPGDPDALQLLGMVAMRRGRFPEAATRFRRLTEVAPRSPLAWCRLGSAAMYGADFDAARAAYARALELDPALPLAVRGAAELEERAGDPEAGLARLAPLVAAGRTVEPETALLHAQLLVAAKRTDDAISVARAALARGDAPPPVRRLLEFTLGRAEDRAGHREEAAAAWTRANAIGARPFDPDAHDRDVDAVIARFTAPPARAGDADASRATSDAPILVVGLPRCGSTLVEQILAAHPQVAGTGESPALPQALAGVSRDLARGRPLPDWWPELDAAGRTRAGLAYVEGLEALLAPDDRRRAMRIVDKNLLNLRLLGAAAAILPHARFVICRRDPLDVGFSCWRNDLSPIGFPWSSDLVHIGRAAAAAERLIAHWPSVLGDRVIVVEYEALVADPEPWTRRLVEHAGLDWDDACLAPHASGRAVTTLSYDQVRRPIYRDAVRGSERYAFALESLVRTLTDAGVRFEHPALD